MSDWSPPSLFLMETRRDHNDTLTQPDKELGFFSDYPLEEIITWFVTLVICHLGLLGNGAVICLLGFQIKRNPFTTYVLNLAAADFGGLISGAVFFFLLVFRKPLFPFPLVYFLLRLFMYVTGHVLLTAISIDTCVSVFFPVWHQCHRPAYLSHTICALIWVLSFLLSGIQVIHLVKTTGTFSLVLSPVSVTALVCFPLTVICTLILFIQVCFKTQQGHRGKFLTATLITLFFSILFAFPFNVIYVISFFMYLPDRVMAHSFLAACLNSSIKPMIYFLIGRQKWGKTRESMKVILQRIFKEEEDGREEDELQN